MNKTDIKMKNTPLIFKKDFVRHIISLPSFFGSYYYGGVYDNFAAVLELSYRCNAKCGYCARWKDKSGNRLNLCDIRRLIDELRGMGYKYCLTLTGGEPFVLKDIMDIIEHIISEGIPIVINSNGLLLDKYIDDLIRLGPKIRSLNISLDSHLPEVHDKTRGVKNGYQTILQNIKKLKDNVNIMVQCTLTRLTLYHVHELMNFSKKIGLRVQIQLVNEEPSNLFNIDREEMKIPVTEFHKMKNYISELFNSMGEGISFSDKIFLSLFPYFIADAKLLQFMKCLAAGRTIYHIDPVGNVYPCESRRDQCFGNIRETPFPDIIKSKVVREWRNICRKKENGCSCLYGCVAFKNIYYQFFPLIGHPYYGFLVKRKWNRFMERLNHSVLYGIEK